MVPLFSTILRCYTYCHGDRNVNVGAFHYQSFYTTNPLCTNFLVENVSVTLTFVVKQALQSN